MSAVTVACLSVLLVCAHASCDWQFGNSCYHLLPETMASPDALRACSAEGAGLVVPNSRAENQFVWHMMKSQNVNRVWVGCTDEYEEGKWVHFGDNDRECTFLDWAPGEPNVQLEHCAQMWNGMGISSDGQLVDIPCSAQAPVICEYPSSPEVTCLQAGADSRLAITKKNSSP